MSSDENLEYDIEELVNSIQDLNNRVQLLTDSLNQVKATQCSLIKRTNRRNHTNVVRTRGIEETIEFLEARINTLDDKTLNLATSLDHLAQRTTSIERFKAYGIDIFKRLIQYFQLSYLFPHYWEPSDPLDLFNDTDDDEEQGPVNGQGRSIVI